MPNLNASLTSLAAILWSGMIIIAGSIWILSSQVRRLSDLVEQGRKLGSAGPRDDAREPRFEEDPPILAMPRRAPLRVVERPSARAN